MCVISMKYKIILITVSLSAWVKYYFRILQTHQTRTGTRTCSRECTQTLPPPFRLSLFDGSVMPNRDGVNAPFHRFHWRSMAGRLFIQINTRAGDPVSRGFGCFSRIKKLLGRTETQTRDRMYHQSIRTV